MAGTGKRAGQKVTWRLKYWPDYFGKVGFKSRQKKDLAINVGEINDRITSLVKKNKATKEKDGYRIELKGYKILSGGRVDKKLFIKAKSFSKKAEEKIVKVGGVAEKSA